ncbi:hypothetical protein [Oenococcus sicerae]|nr:hypothetical protein [Oenococcus sicerae]MDN6900377.1 hypothetical protein [Oenococcus sicerae]
MSYTINEKTFDETENKVNQLKDLLFIFSNHTDPAIDPTKQEEVFKLYDAYQHVQSISGCMIALINDVYQNTQTMEHQYLANRRTAKVADHD